jgi:hypothetical protein
MANLIIKSSADNLVLQGSDASPAITVGATGTTTFAEAATMSGNVTMSGTANNLGTVTAGTLGTGIVYPEHTVLQVRMGTYATATTITTVEELGLDVTITPTLATNKILVTVHINYQHGNDRGLGVTLKRDSTVIYDTSDYSAYGTVTQYNGSVTHSVLDDISTSPAWSSGSITYKTFITGYNNNAVVISDANNSSEIIAMEVVG